MRVLKKEELERINGGFTAWMALGIASTVIFLSGIFQGIVNPKSCEN